MLTLIAQTFGTGLTQPTGGNGLAGSINANQPLASTENFISMIIGFITVLAGLFFLFYTIMGGVSWISAGGDSGKIEKARNQIVQGAIGMVVIVSAYLIVGMIGNIIGLDILHPADTLKDVFNI